MKEIAQYSKNNENKSTGICSVNSLHMPFMYMQDTKSRAGLLPKPALELSMNFNYMIPQKIEFVKSNSKKIIHLFSNTDHTSKVADKHICNNILYSKAVRNIVDIFFYSDKYGYGVKYADKYTWNVMHFEDEAEKFDIAEKLLQGNDIIGGVPVSESKTRFIAFDFDGTTLDVAFSKLKRLSDVLQSDMTPYTVTYSGKKGFHLFITFEDPTSIELCIKYADDILGRAGLTAVNGSKTHKRDNVEIRPASDGISIIKLPMSLHLNHQTQEQLLDPYTFKPLTAEEAIEYFANILPYKNTAIVSAVKTANQQIKKAKAKSSKTTKKRKPTHITGYYRRKRDTSVLQNTISAECSSKHSALKQLQHIATLPAVRTPFLSLITHLDDDKLLALLHSIADAPYVIRDVKEVAYDADAMIDLFRFYHVQVPKRAGKAFKCPFHPEHNPSASIANSKRSGIAHFNDWHNKGEKQSYNISDIHASLVSGKLTWVKGKQAMMQHLIFAAIETGRATEYAKRTAKQLLEAYGELAKLKGVRSAVLSNALKIIVLLVLQSYTNGLTMLSAKYVAKFINRSHSVATNLLKYLSVIGIMRVSQAQVAKRKVDVYLANPFANAELVRKRVLKLRANGLTNISKINQSNIATVFSVQFMQSIYYAHSYATSYATSYTVAYANANSLPHAKMHTPAQAAFTFGVAALAVGSSVMTNSVLFATHNTMSDGPPFNSS